MNDIGSSLGLMSLQILGANGAAHEVFFINKDY
jgi:hypothetical protein